MDSPRKAIYVSNLPPLANKESLQPLFERFGTIRQIVVRRRGVGATAVILFATDEAVTAAIRETNYTVVSNFPIQVKRAFERHDLEPLSRLAFRGVPTATTERDLHVVLSAFGPLDSLQILRTSTGESRGIALAQFLSAASAKAAMALHGVPLKDDSAPLRISYVPVYVKDVNIEPVDDCVVIVDGPAELRTADALAPIFSCYHSGTLEILAAAHSVVIFPTAASAARCAAEFTHASLRVYTFAERSVWSWAIPILADRTAFVTGFAPADFDLLPPRFPSASLERVRGVTPPAAHARFETAAERDRALSLSGFPLGDLGLPVRVLPLQDPRLSDTVAEILVVRDPSLALTESALRDRFAASQPLAVAVAPTVHGDAYGAVLFRTGGAPPAPDGLRVTVGLRGAVRAFAGGSERVVLVREPGELSGIWTRAGGAAIARFADPESTARGLREVAEAGKVAEVASDRAVRFAFKAVKQGMASDPEARTVFVKKMPETVGAERLKEAFAEFGEIEFAAVFAGKKLPAGGIVRFAKAEDAQKAIDGPRTGEFGSSNVKKLRVV